MSNDGGSTFSIEKNVTPVSAGERERLLQNPVFGRVFTDHMATARYTDVVPTEVVHLIGDGQPLDELPLSNSSRRVFADLPQAVAHIAML